MATLQREKQRWRHPAPTRVALDSEQIEVFERLVRRHRDFIYRMAYRLTGNPEDAQDLVQETLLKAYRAFTHFRPDSYFDRWTLRIMRGIYIDLVRKSQVDREVISLDAPTRGGVRIAIEVPDHSTDPAWQLEQAGFSEPVQAGLDSLPEIYRTVVILCDVEGWTYDEISRLLQCPIGTIRSRLHRGRHLLRRRLQPHLEEGPPGGSRRR